MYRGGSDILVISQKSQLIKKIVLLNWIILEILGISSNTNELI